MARTGGISSCFRQLRSNNRDRISCCASFLFLCLSWFAVQVESFESILRESSVRYVSPPWANVRYRRFCACQSGSVRCFRCEFRFGPANQGWGAEGKQAGCDRSREGMSGSKNWSRSDSLKTFSSPAPDVRANGAGSSGPSLFSRSGDWLHQAASSNMASSLRFAVLLVASLSLRRICGRLRPAFGHAAATERHSAYVFRFVSMCQMMVASFLITATRAMVDPRRRLIRLYHSRSRASCRKA